MLETESESAGMAARLDRQIAMLAAHLMDVFGGPDRSESACEMAIRQLTEHRDRMAQMQKALIFAMKKCEGSKYDENEGDFCETLDEIYGACSAAITWSPCGQPTKEAQA